MSTVHLRLSRPTSSSLSFPVTHRPAEWYFRLHSTSCGQFRVQVVGSPKGGLTHLAASTKLFDRESIAELLPTPSKSHYIFNLRYFALVMRGVLLVPAEWMTEPDKLIRLWIHEIYRVFNDRLIDDREVGRLCIVIPSAFCRMSY